MAKKSIGVSLESEKWEALQVEAEKRDVSRNELFDVMTDALLANQPIISEVIDLDRQIKQEKLEKTIEEKIKLRDCNEHFKKYGYYPTKPSNYVTRITETRTQPQLPPQREWVGENFKKTEPIKIQQVSNEPKITDIPDKMWELVLPAMTEFDSKTNSYLCSVNIPENCGHSCQRIESARQHALDNHEDFLKNNIRDFTK